MATELERVLQHLRASVEAGPKVYTVEFLATEAHTSRQIAEQALEFLADRGELLRGEQLRCPCGEVLRTDDPGPCPNCGGADDEAQPVRERTYRNDKPRTRDVRWVLLLHGMNTTGAWQEEVNWKLGRLYGYSVPLAIYKYGVVRPGAVLRFRQRALTRELAQKMRSLTGEAEGSGFGGKPDVIAHSLGTWLFAEALRTDPSLRVGRVVLLGCIVRPDFDWEALRKTGQVEEVLCHYSRKDFWARIAHYIIPGSGPAGVRGFNDRANIAHKMESALAHSDYFIPQHLGRNIEDVWKPFLTGRSTPRDEVDAKPWRQSWWLWRATLWRFLILGLVLGLAGCLCFLLWRGVTTLL